MTLDLDQILDQAIAEAELASGIDPSIVAARSPGVQVAPTIQARVTPTDDQRARWSDTEDQFLIENFGRYTGAEIAIALGRSEVAVKIRRYRHLEIFGVGHGRNPDFVTASQMAIALGIDGHATSKLADRNIIPTWLYGERQIRVTRRVTFYRWAVNPLNWPYIIHVIRNPERMGDAHLRRLIIRQKQRWPDEWWSGAEVGAYHGVTALDVNRYLHAGLITGVKFHNWWFRRSEALKPGLYFQTGPGPDESSWPATGDCFILIGRGLGVQYQIIARLMHWTEKRVMYRLRTLKERGEIPALIQKYGLKIQFDDSTGQLNGSWSDYGHRFPSLFRAR